MIGGLAVIQWRWYRRQCRQEPRNVNNRAMAYNETDFKNKVKILLKPVL